MRAVCILVVVDTINRLKINDLKNSIVKFSIKVTWLWDVTKWTTLYLSWISLTDNVLSLSPELRYVTMCKRLDKKNSSAVSRYSFLVDL